MSLIKSNQPCEWCGSSDAVAHYSNGTFCFSCRKFTKSRNVETLIFPEYSQEERLQRFSSERGFINDLSNNIPREGLRWLRRYGITDKETYENKFQWSPLQRRLVLPVQMADSSKGIAWEARSFDPGSPKTIYSGSKIDAFHVISPKIAEVEGLIAVEDIISAIKVGRLSHSLCLFGSHLPKISLIRIKSRYSTLYLWLDADKFKTSISIAQKAESLGIETKIIRTILDPKCHGTSEIREILKNAI